MTALKKDIVVRGYHTNAKARIKSVEGEYYGFEMEVNFPNKNMRTEGAVVQNGNLPRSRYQLDAERDGSLMNSGVELITKRPLKVTEVRGKWMKSTLSRMVDEMGVQAGRQPNNYGLHINVNMAGMHIGEAMAFLGTLNLVMSVQSVQRAIMERTGEYTGLHNNLDYLAELARQADSMRRPGEDVFKSMRRVHGGVQPYVLPRARMNYAGLRRNKTPIAEVRGFHMNTDIEAFKKKADLVQKARRFANANTEMLVDWFAQAVINKRNMLTDMGQTRKLEVVDAVLSTPLKQEIVNRRYNFSEEQTALIAAVAEEYKPGQSNQPYGISLPAVSASYILETAR